MAECDIIEEAHEPERIPHAVKPKHAIITGTATTAATPTAIQVVETWHEQT